MSGRFIFLLLVLPFFLSGIARAECRPYEKFFHWTGGVNTPGEVYEVAIADTYAYVAGEDGLYVIDITDPGSPILLGSIDVSEEPRSVKVTGNHVLVADFIEGLFVVDVSEPSAPMVVATEDIGNLADLAIWGSYAYVVSPFPRRLSVVDISDPLLPSVIGEFTPPADPYAIEVLGNRAYVTTSTSFHILSISNPSLPWIIGTVDMPQRGYKIRVRDDHAFVTTQDSLMHVIDLEDEHAPELVGTAHLPNQTRGLGVGDRYAYVACSQDGLAIIDITSPTDPEVVHIYDFFGIASGLEFVWPYVYFTDRYHSLQNEISLHVVDVTSITPISIPYTTEIVEEPNGLEIIDDRLYTVDGQNGMAIYDCTDLFNLDRLGTVAFQAPVAEAAIQGNYAYIVAPAYENPFAGFYVVDIADPASPEAVGFLPSTWADQVAVSGDYAYSDAGQGFTVINISNPSSPMIIAELTLPEAIWEIEVREPYAFVVRRQQPYDGAFNVIDISNPRTPELLVTLPLGSLPYELSISGDFAYVGGGAEGLYIVDIHDPPNAEIASHLMTRTTAGTVVAHGNFAYVADRIGAVVVDILDPTHPRVVGSLDTPYESSDIDFKDGYALIADRTSELQIAYLQCDPLSGAYEPSVRLDSAPRIRPLRHPSSRSVLLRLDLPGNEPAKVDVFDVRGTLVRRLAAPRGSGSHEVIWDGLNERGHAVPSGPYFLRLSQAGQIASAKVIIAR